MQHSLERTLSIDPINDCTGLKLRRQHNDTRPRFDRQTCILLDVFQATTGWL
jgi:hypothetical protein